MTKVISKYCAENPKTWGTMLPYLSFVYNTTIHRATGATPFSLVHDQECQYPIDLFYAKPHDVVLTKDGFAEENLPCEAEDRPPGEVMAAEPVVEVGIADDGGRPTRVRRPPVRFTIDEFVS